MNANPQYLHRLLESPIKSLFLMFLAWKAILLTLAALCPGPGYDTSGLIMLSNDLIPGHRHFQFQSMKPIGRLTLSLLRWDALYFVKTAQRGYVNEQEWAFSWAYTRILDVVGRYISGSTEPSLQHFIWAGFAISNACHILSVFVLYYLLLAIVNHQQNGRLAFFASILHIMSPAGLFLCAPYTEAPFSTLNFLGMLLYVRSKSSEISVVSWGIQQDGYMLGSGLLFAIATLIRSNGLLSGLILLYDVVCQLPSILTARWNFTQLRRIVVTSIAGILIAVGFISPQLLAYKEYCSMNSSSEIRPWCSDTVPSIYSWVQSNYWNLGFLRYWNLSNIPLFLIAAPMLWLLFYSSATVLCDLFRQQATEPLATPQDSSAKQFRTSEARCCRFPQLALPQIVLAVTAATNFHVQIINRLSSGYPIWYLVIAKWLTNRETLQRQGKRQTLLQSIIRWMVLYALIQGILFANFLPPA
ncbi:glycosyltransferase family 76 protein [Zopfia rhizophila CBS 207.26]|uniref:GPI mannosyltransferase 2 n=1 Tax=Zopfia rhizophila CBS 207.26 TaxID=1314779 RepID=A0A6A6DFT7_9PEZI|nr:glycosyltransferase family 76 protein [Zopfia rhizophila CBS 207.26]